MIIIRSIFIFYFPMTEQIKKHKSKQTRTRREDKRQKINGKALILVNPYDMTNDRYSIHIEYNFLFFLYFRW